MHNFCLQMARCSQINQQDYPKIVNYLALFHSGPYDFAILRSTNCRFDCKSTAFTANCVHFLLDTCVCSINNRWQFIKFDGKHFSRPQSLRRVSMTQVRGFAGSWLNIITFDDELVGRFRLERRPVLNIIANQNGSGNRCKKCEWSAIQIHH